MGFFFIGKVISWLCSEGGWGLIYSFVKIIVGNLVLIFGWGVSVLIK